MEHWWAARDFEDGIWYRWFLAGAEVFACRDGARWSAAVKTVPWNRRITSESAGPEPVAPPKTDTVFVAAGIGNSAVLVPHLAGKPFLASLGHVRLLPGMEMNHDLALPPSLYLKLEGEILFSFSPFILNESWYGENTMEGTLCRSLPVSSENAGTEVKTNDPALINCSLLIRNRTKTALDIDKILLASDELSIYEDQGELFCTTTVFDAFGGGEFRKSFKAGDGSLISAGTRNSVGDILIHQSSKIIRDISGY